MTEQGADIPARTSGTFRLVVWNCAGGFEKKYDMLRAVSPDLAVIPEACTEARLLRAGIDDFSSMTWIGRYPHKGLATLAFGRTRVALHAAQWDQRLEWVAPVKVSGTVPFNLFAVADQSYSTKIRHSSSNFDRAAGSITDVPQYQPLLGGASVIAGDFNHHPVFDKGNPRRDFADIVDRYRQLGLVSAWHALHHAEHGQPGEPPTHWWQWSEAQPFHIDYCFIPMRWLPAVERVLVGSYAQWGAGNPRSDHAPIVVDLNLNLLKELV